ncbi:glycosyltransferase family 2 protein [Arthrobacter oryzae]|uniref:glycosyltransferase family 2 protein n=1 Tax=Arthrobacter oryzae TaxID=409290 RepID=UPI00273A7B30|nr:glycosyltransferase family 2 protein [Arthrobacter oryzae]WLQ07130.1 glycosyltransferase family 2 protein [Arthrobacter oryzae]
MTNITVGLPVVDGVAEFEFAVRSIFAQTYSDWELIVVCDGSPAALVDRAFQIDDRRVRVIPHRENMGLAHRLNEINSLARHSYIARMDSDDVMHPSRLSVLADFLKENSLVDVVGSASYLINDSNEVEGAYKEPTLPEKLCGYLDSGVFSHPTVVYKAEWALRNPYDPTRVRTEDKELWLRGASSSVYAKVTDRLLFCKVPRSLSVSKQALTAKYDRKLLRDYGPGISSKFYVNFKLGQSLLKQIAFSLSHSVGLMSLIYRTKFSQLPDSERRDAQLVLDSILDTRVPGWD